MDHKSWKFKILTGSYFGVVIDLPEGGFVLGSDDDKSDFVLPSYDLSKFHLRFEVNKDDELYAVLLDKDAVLKVNNNIIEEERFLIKDGSILNTGGLTVALVLGDTPWPEFSEKENNKTENSSSEKNGELSEKTDITGKKTALHPLIRSLLIASFALLIAVFPVSILLISSVITEDDNIAKNIIINEKFSSVDSDLKNTRRLIENAGLHSVNVNLLFSKSKIISVSGYVKTKNDFDEIKSIVKKINTASVLKVRVVETIVQTVNSLLERNGFKGLEAYPGEELGTVVLKGYIKDYSKFSYLENYLNNKVPGLESWTLEYVNSRKLLVIFKRMLALSGVTNIKHVEMDDKKLIVYGDLNNNQNKIFYQQAEYFRRRYGFSPTLEPYTENLSEDTLSIDSVEIGKNSRFTMRDGRVYMRGSKLPNGFIVRDINRKGITLMKGNKAMFYSFGVSNDGR